MHNVRYATNFKRKGDKTMITIQIDNNEALEMLMDRVRYWRDDSTTLELFEKMYQNYIDWGCFDESEFDIMQIVDNDVVNWCSVVEYGEKDFKKLLKLYKAGERDVSCESFKEYKVSFIEAVSDDETAILIRY